MQLDTLWTLISRQKQLFKFLFLQTICLNFIIILSYLFSITTLIRMMFLSEFHECFLDFRLGCFLRHSELGVELSCICVFLARTWHLWEIWKKQNKKELIIKLLSKGKKQPRQTASLSFYECINVLFKDVVYHIVRDHRCHRKRGIHRRTYCFFSGNWFDS